MSALPEPALRWPAARLSAETFQATIEDRPDEERWQLIDGRPFLMMNPPTLVHQRISLNLARHLNDALEGAGHDLFAMIEIGLMIEGLDDFRPIADVAVVGGSVERVHYARDFHLAAEVLSPSNTSEMIGRKRELYARAPDCLHVLILHQTEACAEVWSRADGWRGRVFRSIEDRIALPEFGFDRRLGDLYKGTPVR
ncbi:hypothetical protein GCM10011390_17820 [Aureimonas endophytica]|uniref:Putative restriction endonuclease domain-containing protein n=1 Tax=Aureimonas endophytica TaxID=2027858 RepID=A0A916ZI57_9HYPH|nr:Uma2 family endonuclease [Aureimonas endophytica]GGD99427.1 hypothetical protein GCM10011390_17820 [Aureimonas endophytica]